MEKKTEKKKLTAFEREIRNAIIRRLRNNNELSVGSVARIMNVANDSTVTRVSEKKMTKETTIESIIFDSRD